MNNRFKFRTWDKVYKKYRNGLAFQDNQVCTYDDNSCVLEQCTGLKDRNSNLIYEGDIVAYSQDNWLVIYNEPTMSWGLMGYEYTVYGKDINRSDTYTIDCEIVGNINENPELFEYEEME